MNLNPKPTEKIDLPVSGTTQVHLLSTAISKFILGGTMVRLIAIGPPAVSQMFKSAAKSNEKLAPRGQFVVWKAYFETICQSENPNLPAESSACVMESLTL